MTPAAMVMMPTLPKSFGSGILSKRPAAGGSPSPAFPQADDQHDGWENEQHGRRHQRNRRTGRGRADGEGELRRIAPMLRRRFGIDNEVQEIAFRHRHLRKACSAQTILEVLETAIGKG